MKTIIRAIKKYMVNYNAIQAEMLRTYGTDYAKAQMFASAMGIVAY